MTNTCTIDGCDRPHWSRGWCGAHYQRWAKHGDPMPDKPLKPLGNAPIEDRLNASITKRPSGCWEWTGNLSPDGYGRITAVRYGYTMAAVHRIMFERENGPIPEGMEVRHKCDNPPCCNPAHLEPGTHADNMCDMRERDRAKRASCKNGHPWSDEYVGYRPDGKRFCRVCKDAARKRSDKVRADCPICGSNIVKRTMNAHMRRVHEQGLGACDPDAAFAEHIKEEDQ